jgi:hypothetical protein
LTAQEFDYNKTNMSTDREEGRGNKSLLNIQEPDEMCYIAAPAGGAAAEAPEGGALAGPSASPHLPVVGAGNPIAVPDLAQLGAKRADSSIRGISSCRERHVQRAFEKNNFCAMPGPRSLARPVRYVISHTYTTKFSPTSRRWDMYYNNV